ncbi:MAG: sensor histidine kinase, partial [Spirochaetales bacterium]|nr:sensor histidine kinase [Spirochaetales bacterium]
MIMNLLLIVTVFFSLLTLVVVFYLIKLTKHRFAWILISLGFLLAALVRILRFLNIFIESSFLSSPYLTPAIAFIVSILLFIGLYLIIPVFKSIKVSEARYRSIFDGSGVSLWEEDLYNLYKGFQAIKEEGVTDFRSYLKDHPEFVDKSIKSIKVLDVNQATLDLFKVKNKGVLLSSFGTTFTDKSRDVFIEYLISIFDGDIVFESETEYVDMDGKTLNVILKIISPRDKELGKHSIVSITDITKRSIAEKNLSSTLEQKRMLLRELYHRTKNNMQVIIAMLNLRSNSIGNEIISTAFNDMIGRIQSMSLVHEKLYKSENLSVIKLDEYIEELMSLLFYTETHGDTKIKLLLDLEPVFVDIDRAIPCGLILNELISNTFKHAFTNLDSGVVKISLHMLEDNKVE